MIRAALQVRLRGFTLDVDFESSGPVLGVFGRSGSGKTTLLRALAGLQKPQRGRVEIFGGPVSERPGTWHPPEERGLAWVPQDALLFPHLSVRGNLTYAPRASAVLRGSQGDKVLQVLRLAPLLDRKTATLSGGERQRVALGRALLSTPRALLLDEPAASLDSELSREIMALLLEMKRELAIPMIFVTHRVAEILALADDCVVLDGGSVVARGTPLEVLSRPRDIGVAKLVGVDNLLRLAVQGHDETGGVTMLDLGEGLALASPLCDAKLGDVLDVGVYAEDVLLCREAPSAISARNILPGRIRAMDSIGAEVLVAVSIGNQELRVRITTGAASELALAPGHEVHALIKTTACHHLK